MNEPKPNPFQDTTKESARLHIARLALLYRFSEIKPSAISVTPKQFDEICDALNLLPEIVTALKDASETLLRVATNLEVNYILHETNPMLKALFAEAKKARAAISKTNP